MKVAGHLELPENANAVTNLIVPSGTTFPTASNGELFYLTQAVDEKAAGFYQYYNAWNLVTIDSNALNINTDTQEPTGIINRTDSIISYTDSPRLFTIAPATTSYTFYNRGTKHVRTAPESIAFTDTEGTWYFYYDSDGVLSVTENFPGTNNGIALIASIYWDSTNKKVILFCEERHGCTMDWATHEYLHNTVGTRYGSGFGAGNYTTAGNGNNTVDVTLSLADGVVYDEDNRLAATHSISGLPFTQFLAGTVTGLTGTPTSTTLAKIPLFYRSGANGYIRKINASNAPVVKGASRAQFNKLTTGVWSLADATNNYYIAIWIGATNNIYEPVIGIIGQREDTSLANAQANNTPNALTFGEFPLKEFKYLYRLIYQCSNYTNNYGARLRGITDYREVSSLPGAVTPSQTHESLSGLTSLNAHPGSSISLSTTNFNTF